MMYIIISSINFLVLLQHIAHLNNMKLQDKFFLQCLAIDYLLKQSMSDA